MERTIPFFGRPEYSDEPRRRRRRFLIWPILLALAYMAFQYFTAETFTNPETGEISRVATSLEQESALGLQGFAQVLSESRTIDSGPDFDRVVRVTNKLMSGLDERSQSYEWAAALIDSPTVNAFCLPGGKIAVYTGILPVARDDEGLAAILGHEIAHATARHGAQRLLQQQLVQTAMLGAQGSVADLSDSDRRVLLGALGAGVQYGIILPYGRRHELEADEIGLHYMVRAGFDPHAAVAFWQRMEEMSEAQPPEWASTHPSHGSRLARLEELIPRIVAEENDRR